MPSIILVAAGSLIGANLLVGLVFWRLPEQFLQYPAVASATAPLWWHTLVTFAVVIFFIVAPFEGVIGGFSIGAMVFVFGSMLLFFNP